MTTKVTADLERHAVTAIFVGHARAPTQKIDARKANHNHHGHSDRANTAGHGQHLLTLICLFCIYNTIDYSKLRLSGKLLRHASGVLYDL